MIITIDSRETSLIDKILKINKHHIINKENLVIGDIIISTVNNDIINIIERKTMSDLIASIKDGRYKEQKFRLNELEFNKHNIMYIIEGYTNDDLVFSAITSLNFFNGFSVFRTVSIDETAKYILCMADKIYKDFDKSVIPQYTNVVKKKKCDHITKDIIGIIMLKQIPNVGDVCADVIMEKYKTIHGLVDSLKKDPKCLDGLVYTKDGHTKKLSKNKIDSIINFLI